MRNQYENYNVQIRGLIVYRYIYICYNVFVVRLIKYVCFHGYITGVKKILFSQCFGGLIFALFGGQPLIVLLTTAPLALYTKSKLTVCLDKNLCRSSYVLSFW